jgi:hypothetical protein
MGVIFKLKPEIRDFIIEQKKASPDLSCRKLTCLVEEKFQLKVSKSSINSVFKQLGLSMPVGRRPNPEKEVKPERLLLAVKSAAIALFGPPQEKCADLVPDSSKISQELLPLVELNNVSPNMAPASTDTVVCLKIDFSDGKSAYLDCRGYTIWSSTNLPNGLYLTLCELTSYINRHFEAGDPLVLFTAPGNDVISEEFINFILAMETRQKSIEKIVLLGEESQELSVVAVKQGVSRQLIFAMWPWQFVRQRKVIKIGEFKPLILQSGDPNYYIADTEIELSQDNAAHVLRLSGCALKTSLSEKIRMVILTNLISSSFKIEDLASAYLTAWPTPFDTLQDYDRRIELSTYIGTSFHPQKNK